MGYQYLDTFHQPDYCLLGLTKTDLSFVSNNGNHFRHYEMARQTLKEDMGGAMLMIRKEQMDAFGRYMLRQFENLQLAHLNQHYPKECRALGEKVVRNTIRYGIKKSKTYDVRIEFDVSRYINMMFSFGRNYDADPALPWASAIFNDESSPSGTAKMNQLYEEAKKYPDLAVGLRQGQKEIRS